MLHNAIARLILWCRKSGLALDPVTLSGGITAALSMLLARFADEISNPDPGDFAIVAMASDGIADMLMLAIEEYERLNEREYEE